MSVKKPVTVTVLGTGDAFASHGRFQAGYAISANGGVTLMDPGPSVLSAMKRTAIRPADIHLILVSHLHGDHYAGLPFLILEYLWETPLKHDIIIAGPPHLENRTWAMMNLMYPRFDVSKIKHHLKFEELELGETARFGGVRVKVVRTPHLQHDTSMALRVEVDGRSVVFSGDAGWTDGLVELVDGANLFLCECTYFQSAHLTFHLNYPLLAAKRDLLKADRMLLVHIGREVLERSSEVEFEMASDGMTIEL